MAFIFIAAMITIASTLFSNKLAKDLAMEERKKMELWAEAIRSFAAETENGSEMDYTLSLKVIEGNTNIPVILLDEKGNILDHKNLPIKDPSDTTELNRIAKDIIEQNHTIEVKINDAVSHFIYYKDSNLLTKLIYFPFVQLFVMFVFLTMTLLAMNSSKRAEQNRVWVGLSKETAHQLGTPISSLLAWIELLKLKQVDASLLNEMEKDTKRLNTIAERFSKIGSKSEATLQPVGPILENAVQYMKNRSSKQVMIQLNMPDEIPQTPLNAPLIEWVVENLCKNAMDAMEGKGKLDITLTPLNNHIQIDFKDSGKGIPKSHFKNVFKPGFTTKKRGWGLGLSLVKRIVEEGHNGRIFVKASDLGKGTTFRMLLPYK